MKLPKQQEVQPADSPPPYYKEATLHPLPGGPWDRACNIDVQGPFVQLNATGEPTWTHIDSVREYWRDSFRITLNISQIMVTNQICEWTCVPTSDAGQLLNSKRDTISLRCLGPHLLVFERTVITKIPNQPTQKHREDQKGSLKIKPQSSNIWTITGTEIYQVEGYEDDVVIMSPKYLRLWDMAKRKFRWQRRDVGSGRIWGFTHNYVVKFTGNCRLHKRGNGHFYGDFSLPCYEGLTDQEGMVIGDRTVDVRIWKSNVDIQGYLLVRGELDDLKLEIIGQQPAWARTDDTWIIIKEYDPIKRRIR